MLVLLLGPWKPFVEAWARTQTHRVHMLVNTAASPLYFFILSQCCMGFRFGVTHAEECVSMPHEDLRPSN